MCGELCLNRRAAGDRTVFLRCTPADPRLRPLRSESEPEVGSYGPHVVELQVQLGALGYTVRRPRAAAGTSVRQPVTPSWATSGTAASQHRLRTRPSRRMPRQPRPSLRVAQALSRGQGEAPQRRREEAGGTPREPISKSVFTTACSHTGSVEPSAANCLPTTPSFTSAVATP